MVRVIYCDTEVSVWRIYVHWSVTLTVLRFTGHTDLTSLQLVVRTTLLHRKQSKNKLQSLNCLETKVHITPKLFPYIIQTPQ